MAKKIPVILDTDNRKTNYKLETLDEIAPINAPFPMPQLKRPVFPCQIFNISDYGAKGDGTTKNTEAFLLAIAACNTAGGGTVLVPAGKWLTGAIHLKSNVNLQMDEGAEIHFSDDPNDYLPVVFTRYGGVEVMNYSPLIYANGCENIAVTGPGKLFGHGQKWWEWCERLNEKDKVGPKLQDMAVKGVLPADRVFGNPDVGLRPQFISPVNCRNVLLEGFTIADPGPSWTIDTIYCENVIARKLTIRALGGPNLDGIDLDSTRNALVEHCYFDTGDDAIAIKSGLNEDGWRVGKPSENIVVRHCQTKGPRWGSISIGSEMSGGVRNVSISDITFDGVLLGIYIKSNPSRGGMVENIYYRNITMHRIKEVPILFQSNYAAWGAAEKQTNYPTFRNINFTNIVCDGAGNLGGFRSVSVSGSSHNPIENLRLEHVVVTNASHGMFFENVRGLTLEKITCNILIKHCTDVVRSVAALPAILEDYDPSGQIRFRTSAEADTKRQELIHYIWPDGLPTNTLPAAATNIGAEVFSGDLKGLNGELAASVDRLDSNVSGMDFHSIAYLLHPKTTSANTTRLVIAHQGHQGRLVDGVGDAINRLLEYGFTVLAMQMPLVGWNTWHTITLPDGGGTVTITNRGTSGHTEVFSKLTPILINGGCFRFFLEPVVQCINYFQHTTPEAADVSMFGLSGGGWTTHMVPAVDTRIKQSFPVAGAYPGYIQQLLPPGSADTEQTYAPLYLEIVRQNPSGIPDTAAGVASKLEIFALAGYGPGRRQIQILNLYDYCCFYGLYFITYINFVSAIVRNLGQGQWDFYSDSSHMQHLISSNALENVIVPALVAKAGTHERQPAVTLEMPDEIAPINAPFPMPQLKRPVFPCQIFNISDYSAKGDGTTKNTEAFRQAIAACNVAGGGTVLVPAGKWLTGAIHLMSNVKLYLVEGSEIHFSDDPSDYLPVVFTRCGGVEVMNYSPLIYANGCENIAVTGPGKLFGHGQKWWEWCERLNEKDKVGPKLQDMAVKGVLPADRVFGNPDVGLRPQFISPVNCRNVLLEGFTIADPGPSWTIDTIYCENVIARKLTIRALGGPNLDGIDLDSTRNALVEHCLFDVGDDAVCLKSGLNEDGRRVGRPTENVVVRNVTVLSSHGGIVIGSEMSGGVRNVMACDCDYDGSDRGIRLKSNPARGGVVENIYYRNITMHRIKAEAIVLESTYAAWGAAQNQMNYPLFRNINLADIVCDGTNIAVSVKGSSHKPVENLRLERVVVTGAKKGMLYENVHGLTLENVTCNGLEDSTICIKNCADVVRSATVP